MKILSYILVVMYLIFAGVDRINFGPHITDSFQLSPHLILSFFFVLFQLLFRIEKINFEWFYRQRFIFLSTIVFITLLIISCFLSIDIFFSFKRIILLLIIIGTVLCILSSFSNKELSNCLYTSSIYGSILFYIFNILLFMHWLNYMDFNNDFINFHPDSIHYFYPRLGGFSLDANRGTFLIIFYTYLLFISKKENILKNIIIVINIFFIIASFSRTGILLFFVSFLLYFIFYSSKKNRLRLLFSSVFSILLIFSVTNYYSNLKIINVDSALQERLSFVGNHETSGGIHVKLIKDGIKIVTSDIKLFLAGCGYGVSWKIIKGYSMSRKKNANFHSQYLSFFVESGFIVFMLCLFLTFLYPLFNQNQFFPFICGLFFFNLFYQLNHEPLYWFSIFYYYKILFLKKQHV